MGSARCADPCVPAAVMPPRQPSPCGDEGLESSAGGMVLTNCLSPSLSPRLLSRLHTSVDASLFFPLIEEAVLTVKLKDEPPSPSLCTYPSGYHLCWCRAAVGWLEAGVEPGTLPALPPHISTAPRRYSSQQHATQKYRWCSEDSMSCWMPRCPALSMCRRLAALPIVCLER